MKDRLFVISKKCSIQMNCQISVCKLIRDAVVKVYDLDNKEKWDNIKDELKKVSAYLEC